jgi:predicted small lipoprotein YifL
MKKIFLSFMALFFLACSSLAGCTTHVHSPPSKVIIKPDTPPKAVWVKGHWKYKRGHLIWVPGHWRKVPRW